MIYTVLSNDRVGKDLARLWIAAPGIAGKAQPGQFVVVRVDEMGERLPFTIADSDTARDAVMLLVQIVGAGTAQLASANPGDSFASITGPLGKPTHFGDAKRVLAIGGGVGTAVLYPQVSYLSKHGYHVEVIEGARTQDLLVLVPELSAMASKMHLITDDGSSGEKGFVTDLAKRLLDSGERFDLCIAIGPPVMMRAVSQLTKQYDLPTMVSLNPIMVDGTGMCGCCRVTVGGKVKYACIDGPEFNGHQVDFDGLIKRLGAYRDEEAQAMERHKCRSGLHG